MANQVAYSRKSIINLSKDTIKVSYGTVERNGSNLSLVGRARCGFEYNFNTTGETIRADQLQLQVTVASSNSDGNTRYNSNIAVLMQVQYWEEVIDSAGAITDYVDGTYDVFKVFPYLVTESDGYNDIYNFSISSAYIKSIYIEFINLNEEDTITFSDVSLLYSITVSQAVAETVGFDISLLGVDWYPNGFKVTYDGSDTDDKFYWNGDEQDELNGINVNGVKLIYMRNHNELLE
jgi:hypothetical protein